MTRKSKLVNDERENHERGNTRSRNEIMSAGMSNFGKGVIFSIEVHTAAHLLTRSGFESGAKPVGMTLDQDTLAGEEVTDSAMGILLLVRQFRMFVDLCWMLEKR